MRMIIQPMLVLGQFWPLEFEIHIRLQAYLVPFRGSCLILYREFGAWRDVCNTLQKNQQRRSRLADGRWQGDTFQHGFHGDPVHPRIFDVPPHVVMARQIQLGALGGHKCGPDFPPIPCQVGGRAAPLQA